MSFLKSKNAQTLVMVFGKDDTFSSSPTRKLHFCKIVQDMGVNLLLINLPGHSSKGGKATEESCLDAVRSAYSFVKSKWEVPDNHLFFLGQSISSGLVGALAEEHPDINPIFVDGYSSLTDATSFIPIVGYLLKPLLWALYKLNTLEALRSLRGRACIISSQQDRVFDGSHLIKMMKAAREAQHTATHIMVNGEHCENEWMTDPQVLSQFKTYLESTITKAMEYNNISDLIQLETYLYKYSSTLSRAEKQALAERARDIILETVHTPEDIIKEFKVRNYPDNSTVHYSSPLDVIYNCKYGGGLIEGILETKYYHAIASSNNELAKKWVDFVTTGRFSGYGKGIKEHWNNQAKDNVA